MALPQTIISTNAGSSSIGPYGTNFREIWMRIHQFPSEKNQVDKIVSQMVVILFPPQYAKGDISQNLSFNLSN